MGLAAYRDILPSCQSSALRVRDRAGSQCPLPAPSSCRASTSTQSCRPQSIPLAAASPSSRDTAPVPCVSCTAAYLLRPHVGLHPARMDRCTQDPLVPELCSQAPGHHVLGSLEESDSMDTAQAGALSAHACRTRQGMPGAGPWGTIPKSPPAPSPCWHGMGTWGPPAPQDTARWSPLWKTH